MAISVNTNDRLLFFPSEAFLEISGISSESPRRCWWEILLCLVAMMQLYSNTWRCTQSKQRWILKRKKSFSPPKDIVWGLWRQHRLTAITVLTWVFTLHPHPTPKAYAEPGKTESVSSLLAATSCLLDFSAAVPASLASSVMQLHSKADLTN